ncbi:MULTISPECIES: DUF742 domain-containing protein [Micromonospora]|uniref:DUF742 domain-containing protein n=1 Tax=Micromonospora solifontis TaxID=2487138 RepID=A0ABX9WJ89_9ACTN|nr:MULTISPECIES: DUF742 domain-containing protein [Micromonospora]NES15570.1 DUF742 domain-containing protein [Micromonospora sp. PPF5-17B]NES35925.1 DUF742 domain-containing protein [Micromonospora solifontis]NES56895.1 DUF742 domain-containing protein [Micromonospora sp. PPF5-6]RNM00210.1 DUF742 domain-containing protein [Micromonospora solifontis]
MRAESPGPQHEWLDGAAGPVVRPYTLTGGRVRPPVAGFDLVAFVLARPAADATGQPGFQPEHRRLVELARRPAAVADLAADLNLAVGVVRVLLGDLVARGLVAVHQPPTAAYLPDDNILKAVVSGLRAL